MKEIQKEQKRRAREEKQIRFFETGVEEKGIYKEDTQLEDKKRKKRMNKQEAERGYK